ncbi:hypothetical protein K2173_019128 [Erythroxylum novogranatense]|uniref:Gem-associated protein 2 n=1 Tax=Erythroxylum novogranatense TaxID=1862640 RepID=A0AAV8STG7_9ROSI|nr:hypothetical protein K2173_019128 [Erythroxylum novogranatense]
MERNAPQPLAEDRSTSLCKVSTVNESKVQSLSVSSQSEQSQTIQENLDSSSFKKDNSIFFESENSSVAKMEVGFEQSQELLGSVPTEDMTVEDLASGSFERDRDSEGFVKKVENIGMQVQETENAVVEGAVNGLKEGKDKNWVECELGFSGEQGSDNKEVYGGCKVIEFGVGLDNDVNKEIMKSKELEKETFLEAKKKQLLAGLDDGSIFNVKNHGESVAGFHTGAEIFGGLKGIDISVRKSLEIEVIDDTALIKPVAVTKHGNAGPKISERNEMKNEKQEVDAKGKRPRRKGKHSKNVSGTGGSQNASVVNGNQTKKMYSRKEMQALRFVNIVEQRKLWGEIYSGLGQAVSKEYDDLAVSKYDKNHRVNFDPHHRFGKKEHAPDFLRADCSVNEDDKIRNMKEHEVENIYPLDSDSYSVGGEDGLEEYSEEDSDEYYESIQRPAFHVEGEPNFDSGTPEDGLEYLRRVRWEAAHIPKVTVAKLDENNIRKEQTVYMPQIPDIAPTPQHLMPSKEWEDAFLTDFSELRLFFSQYEGSSSKISHKLQTMFKLLEVDASCHLSESEALEELGEHQHYEVLSCSPLHSSLENTASPMNVKGGGVSRPSRNPTDSSCDYPTLSQILSMDSVARVSMLRKRISLAETASSLLKNDCVWLFALCAAVDTPLDADTCAALRSLLRKCANLRAVKSEVDDEVVMMNILATISGRYFGQSEM